MNPSLCKLCKRSSELILQVVTTDPNKTVPILDIKPSNYGITKLLMVRWTEELASREKATGDSINKLR